MAEGGGGGSGGDGAQQWRPPPHPLLNDVDGPILQGPKLVLSPEERLTVDMRPAAEFYAAPRIGVRHADDAFLQRVSEIYTEVLSELLPPASNDGAGPAAAPPSPPGGGGGGSGGGAARRPRVLDLCSSWESHLDPGLAARLEVVGHGINADELAANKALSSWFVQDLDESPLLRGLASGSLDAALCCNSAYYLSRLEEVAAEVAHALAPRRGVFVVVIGADCFRGRALAGMLARPLDGRAELISKALLANGFSSVRAVRDEPLGLVALVAAAAPPPAADPPRPSATPEAAARALWAPAISHPLPQPPSPPPAASAAAAAGGGRAHELAVMEWRGAYGSLCADAAELGIPASAIPRLPVDDAEVTLEVVRAAQAHLQNMVASFLSAGL
ncbi:MAG: hypothetical protein J3K34DRAFT_508208 [Monoraphidium minutum]|nr:MAG: hypothetical protein J3K34DRAFT_508208 [Monoraphidium minutum]